MSNQGPTFVCPVCGDPSWQRVPPPGIAEVQALLSAASRYATARGLAFSTREAEGVSVIEEGQPGFLSVGEAAAEAGIPESTAYKLVKLGQFPSVENPVQVFTVGGQKKISRYQLTRVLHGLPPIPAEGEPLT